jgi:hypothetical protein
VVEALRRVCAESESDAGVVLTLQSAHLSEAARIFTASIQRMERDLDSIAARVECTPEASRALLGISGDNRGSFFLKMEGQFSAILAMLGSCTAAQAEMESTASSLEETIRHMRDSIAEIRGTEIRIQRISTNATIWATHIGTAGIALNTIAEAMQRLALESNANTEEVGGTLEAMSDAAGRVAGRSPDAAFSAQSITHQVVEEMRRTVGELHSLSQASSVRVNHIAALGTRLAADIGRVRSGVSAGEIFAEAVERVRDDLDRFGAKVSRDGVQGTPERALESFGLNYTMQRERDVHRAVATGRRFRRRQSKRARWPPKREIWATRSSCFDALIPAG